MPIDVGGASLVTSQRICGITGLSADYSADQRAPLFVRNVKENASDSISQPFEKPPVDPPAVVDGVPCPRNPGAPAAFGAGHSVAGSRSGETGTLPEKAPASGMAGSA